MTTGYQNNVVAEARQRLRDVLTGIDNVIKLQTQAKSQEQYNFDPSPLYSAARHSVIAVSQDFEIFKTFVKDNESDLYADEPAYYAYMIDNIEMQISNLENTIIIPSLTSPIAAGSVENDTSVGMSFSGKVVLVPDGDTLTVRQEEKDVAPRDYAVRVAGIDAAEAGTSCGALVASLTSEFWLGKEVTVYYDRHTPNDLYGRVLGTVYWGDTNFALWSLDHCYSSPNLKFSKNHFVDPDEIKRLFSKCVEGCPIVGSIKITTLPTHATVRYGKVGESLILAPEITPCEIVLSTGRYRIALSAPGCGTVIDDIDVSTGKQQLPVYNLVKIPVITGQISIEVPPVGNPFVYADGELIGVAPVSIDRPVDVVVKIVVDFNGAGQYSEDVVPVVGEIKRVIAVPDSYPK